MGNYEYNYINKVRENVVPDAHKKHFGSYMSFDDKPLSKGCMACKTGGWLCVFIGNKCNCACPNCPNPNVNKGADVSVASGVDGVVDIDRILLLLEKSYYKGVGISGGEPLLYIDKLVDWVTKIKAKFPDIYVWNYTNGIYATEENLNRLAEAGLDEIRFDLAADNYSDLVLNNMKLACGIIPSVGIEVPVILEQYNDLVKAVDFADKCGVKYLNLHDIYVNDKMYKNGLGGHVLSFDRISRIQRDIFSSEMLIYKVFRHIKDNNLNIIPNDCTLINMQLQTFGMRYQNVVDEANSSISFDEYIDKMFELYTDEDLLIEKI